MRPRTSRDPYGDDVSRQIRFANFKRLLSLFPTKAEFGRATEISDTMLCQFFVDPDAASWRPTGSAAPRRVERALDLPDFSMEDQTQIEALLPAIVRHCVARGLRASMPTGPAPVVFEQKSTRARLLVSTPVVRKPLHQATIDALSDALGAGRLSDTDCVALMSAWLSTRTEPAAEALAA